MHLLVKTLKIEHLNLFVLPLPVNKTSVVLSAS